MKTGFQFAIWLSLFCLVSCKKEHHSEPSNEAVTTQSLSKIFSVTDNGVLRISSVSDYRRIVDEFSSEQKQQVIEFLNNLPAFRSLKEARTSSTGANLNVTARTSGGCDALPDSVLEEVPLISSMLNGDGVLQVGTYMYKANWDLSSVFVMNASNASENYNDLINCTVISDRVGQFPMDVDVIDYAEDGQWTYPGDDYETDSLTGRLFCFRRGARPHWGSNHGGYDDWVECEMRWMKIKVQYLKLGIYFLLYTHWKGQTFGSFGYLTMGDGNGTREWYGTYTYRYRVKCGGDGSGSGTVYAPLGGEDKAAKIAYEGSRGLASYSMCSDFAIKCKYLLQYPPKDFCKETPPDHYMVYSLISGSLPCISD